MLTYASFSGEGTLTLIGAVDGATINAKVMDNGKDAIVTARADGRMLRAVGTARRAAAAVGWWLHGSSKGAEGMCRCLCTGMGFGAIQKAPGSKSYR